MLGSVGLVLMGSRSRDGWRGEVEGEVCECLDRDGTNNMLAPR